MDRCLKLSETSRMSEQKEKQLARLSVRLPYEEAKKVYEELTGQRAGRMTAHRTVQRLGRKVSEKASSHRKQELPEKSPNKNHITADGTMIHIRGEGWKEAKVGACYQVNGQRRAQFIRYTGTFESREKLGNLLYDLCGKPEMTQTKKMAFVADAAEWLEAIQQFHFPGATLIVDFWHAARISVESRKSFLWRRKPAQPVLGRKQSTAALPRQMENDSESIKAYATKEQRSKGNTQQYDSILFKPWP